MSKLFIANTTKQNHRFYYRLPAYKDHSYVEIPAGGQVQIPHDLTAVMEMDAVLEQLVQYGAKDIREVTEHTPDFSGLAFFVDSQISKDQILIGHEAVVENAEVRSIEEVAKAAKGFDIINRDGESVQEKMQGRRRGKMVEVQIVQDVDPRNPSSNPIDTKFVVTSEAHEDFAVKR